MSPRGLAFAATFLVAPLAVAQGPARPRITGVAHVALYVRDIDSSRAYYKGVLGYAEPFHLENPDGSLSTAFIRIGARQYVELLPEREAGGDRLAHIAVETDDAEAMRAYLKARGVAVPDTAGKARIGNVSFNVKDPDGHTLEFVQYEADGWSLRDRNAATVEHAISPRLRHVGILANALDGALRFYAQILGFRETWRGSRDGQLLDWVNLQVPEGEDYVELMLYRERPAPDKRGSQHHLCLEVGDLDAALATLRPRAAAAGYARPLEIRTGINRRRQLNLFDPDGTRSELMEPHTVDGKKAPSSSAPPPR